MECGECTLCCKLLPIPWESSNAGEYCKYCVHTKGCKKFKTADKRCLEFECAYRQMKKVSIKLRPDNCGVIFERVSDNIFLGTKEKKTKLNEIVMKQIFLLNREGFSVVIHSLFEGKKIHLAKGHIKEDIINEVKRKWHHQATLQT